MKELKTGDRPRRQRNSRERVKVKNEGGRKEGGRVGKQPHLWPYAPGKTPINRHMLKMLMALHFP